MKKGKKRGHRLYAFVVIVLGIAIVILSIIVFFYVQKIDIKGNKYTKSIEIIEVLQEDPLSVNTLYILGKHAMNKYEMPASLSSVDISLSAPWALEVKVEEKKIVGYVYDEDGYVYFDHDGLVVCKGREVVAEVPQVEGFDVDKATLYKTLNCAEKKLFSVALDLLQEIQNCELNPDRIVCENGELYLYFGEVCVALGNTISTEKVAQIKPIIAELEGKSGILHLEFYENESSTVTFNQGETLDQKADESLEEAEAAEESETTDAEETEIYTEESEIDTEEEAYIE